MSQTKIKRPRELLILIAELIEQASQEDQGANQAVRVIASALDGEDWRLTAPRKTNIRWPNDEESPF